MKSKSCIALVEMRACILQSAEINPGPEHGRELDEIEEELAKLRAAEAQRMKQEEEMQLLERARNAGILRELTDIAAEIKKAGDYPYVTETGAEKLDRLFPYLQHIFPGAEMVPWLGTRCIVTNETQRASLEMLLKETMAERIREDLALQKAIDMTERMKVGKKDADRKRDYPKTAW